LATGGTLLEWLMWLSLLSVLSAVFYVVKYHLTGTTTVNQDNAAILFGVYGILYTTINALVPECSVGVPGARTAALVTTLVTTTYDVFRGGQQGSQATAAVLVHLLLATVRAGATTTCQTIFGLVSLFGFALMAMVPHVRPAGAMRLAQLNAPAVLLCLPYATVYEIPLLVAVAYGTLDKRFSHLFAAAAVLVAASNPEEPPARVLLGCAMLAFTAVHFSQA
jgi:hypothetical protein